MSQQDIERLEAAIGALSTIKAVESRMDGMDAEALDAKYDEIEARLREERDLG